MQSSGNTFVNAVVGAVVSLVLVVVPFSPAVGAYLAAVRHGAEDASPNATDAPAGRAARDDPGLAED